jgi:hypothetical protein
VNVHVIAEDIDLGIRDDCYCCPIAQSLKRMGMTQVAVRREFISADNKVFACPIVAKRFMHRFDNCYSVEPFEFELREIEDE